MTLLVDLIHIKLFMSVCCELFYFHIKESIIRYWKSPDVTFCLLKCPHLHIVCLFVCPTQPGGGGGQNHVRLGSNWDGRGLRSAGGWRSSGSDQTGDPQTERHLHPASDLTIYSYSLQSPFPFYSGSEQHGGNL